MVGNWVGDYLIERFYRICSFILLNSCICLDGSFIVRSGLKRRSDAYKNSKPKRVFKLL